MDYFRLPLDIKEIIASNLPAPDLASIANVDPELRSFFHKKVAPTFISEFIRISKIFKYLEKIFYLKVSSHDIMEDDGDHKIMSYILDREVEENEMFEDNTEYAIWRTMTVTIDLEPNMPQLVDAFVHERNVFNDFMENELDNVLDEYWEENELDNVLDEYWEEHGYIAGDYL